METAAYGCVFLRLQADSSKAIASSSNMLIDLRLHVVNMGNMVDNSRGVFGGFMGAQY